MIRTLFRTVTALSLGAVIVASGLTILAGNGTTANLPDIDIAEAQGVANAFRPCPWPPCAAPCTIPAPPQVWCRGPNGLIRTSFHCCCCGSGSNSFRPL